mgnify:CR=1 FL=1
MVSGVRTVRLLACLVCGLFSLQTVTVNLPRAAYLAKKNNTTIEQELDADFEVAEKILLKKKKFIEKELCIDGSKLPF